MMENNLVSIITPAYNASSTIEETYKSILSQTYDNWEWIVIDDFSTDNTFDIVSGLAKNNPKITLIRPKEKGGAAVARNAGIEIAKGRFVAFLDSDDLWMPKKIEKQIEFMLTNNYAFTYTNYEVFSSNKPKKIYIPKKEYATYKMLLKTCDIGCLTAVYDVTMIGKVYMPLDAIKREDQATWLDITRNGVVAHKLNAVLSAYRVGEKTVSSNKIKMIKYQYLLYRKHEHFNVIKSLWYTMLIVLNKMFNKYIY